MEYKTEPEPSTGTIKPRLIIHGGAGNIKPTNLTPERYQAVRKSLLGMIAKTHTYMFTPKTNPSSHSTSALPSALEVATYAVTLLENDPLFNAGKGAVFTRDGIQQLEASVMVSKGYAKRAAGVLGLRHVKNPILLAKEILQHGEDDLWGKKSPATNKSHDVSAPSAQGHTLVYGAVAEALAEQYGLDMEPTAYFYTQQRWDEHIRALEREKKADGIQSIATWSADEYLPQGTTGAVALDSQGVVCCATSTGGLTNKLTGRIGDTPMPGAGYWAEEWTEKGDPTGSSAPGFWQKGMDLVREPGAALEFAGAIKGWMADCLPTPFVYSPLLSSASVSESSRELTTTRSFATSGTGNGDSFLRVNAGRTAAAIARWKPVSSAVGLAEVTGPGGELQQSAGDRWGLTGEGEGGMIGIESVIVRDGSGRVVETRSEVLQDHNCPGMFRAWIDQNDKGVFQVWHESEQVAHLGFDGEQRPEYLGACLPEKQSPIEQSL
ncbi:asparaginase-like protein [Coniella lustricola]|uniref:Asparaginase-like protein n=1 Tax=Coniella lustricola TaxID=2025994 RepID=A0A2T2ZYF9_9PEZI|nr:asparaginase-like protein [Coniella lustricola]